MMRENKTVIQHKEDILCNRPYEINSDGVIVVNRENRDEENLPKDIFRVPKKK